MGIGSSPIYAEQNYIHVLPFSCELRRRTTRPQEIPMRPRHKREGSSYNTSPVVCVGLRNGDSGDISLWPEPDLLAIPFTSQSNDTTVVPQLASPDILHVLVGRVGVCILIRDFEVVQLGFSVDGSSLGEWVSCHLGISSTISESLKGDLHGCMSRS